VANDNNSFWIVAECRGASAAPTSALVMAASMVLMLV
jgi:hypothetical protein